MKHKEYNQSLVSVIIPTYNASQTIQRTIKSVEAQSYKPIEIIVVDDCSGDDTIAKLRAFGSHIQLYQLQQNKGVAYARNKGLDEASGRYVAFLDADDTWLPDKIRKQMTFINQNDVGACYTSLDYGFFDQGCWHSSYKLIPPEQYRKADSNSLLIYNRIATSSVLLDRQIIGDIVFENFRNRQDMLLWHSLLLQGYEFRGLLEVLTRYDVAFDGISANKAKMQLKHWYAIWHALKGRPHIALYVCAANFLSNVKRAVLLLGNNK